MVSPASTVKTIDSTINQAARSIFQYIKPSILLVGKWDDIYDDIKEYFQWAQHVENLSGTVDSDLALVVVNSRAHVKNLKGRISPYTAILMYDLNQVIPISDRDFAPDRIICYLHHISPRYVRGHIRTLLQLQHCIVRITDNLPYLISNEIDHQTFHSLIRNLDKSQISYIKTDDVNYFFALFKSIVHLTHYESAIFIDSVNDIQNTDAYDVTTLVIHVESKKHMDQCLALDLAPFSVLFVSSASIFKNVSHSSFFSFENLLMSKETFHLVGYYYSLYRNLIDEDNRTRFVQAGDMDRFCEMSTSLEEYINHLDNAFTNHNIRFRNIPVRIHDVPFCRYPLEKLLDQFEFAVLRELMSQTNQSQELAELVSGIQRIVLKNRVSRLGL